MTFEGEPIGVAGMKDYTPPRQARAAETERRFLEAFQVVMSLKGFAQTTIEDVAEHAGLNRSAFLKRFGSKEQALFALYGQYCAKASDLMRDIRVHDVGVLSIDGVLMAMTVRFEALLREHFAANRAMHEHFMANLEIHDATRQLFRECVALVTAVQQSYLPEGTYSKVGAYSAAQLLVTIDYNFVLMAMPGLPREAEDRHRLIVDLLKVALSR